MNLLEQKKSIKNLNKTLIKCLFIFISLIAMFCCREKGKDNAYLNAFIYFVSDTYHCPITSEDTLSGREIELYFEIQNLCNSTVFFPLFYGRDSTFNSRITLPVGGKTVYPQCINIGSENPVVFKDTDVFRACIQINSDDLNQLGIADTLSLSSLRHQLDISYFSSNIDHNRNPSKYNQCQSLNFILSPFILVEYGALYRGYH